MVRNNRFLAHTNKTRNASNILKDQQMHFRIMDVILKHSGRQHVSATNVFIFTVVRTRICIELKCV
jgi:hypothetical protein